MSAEKLLPWAKPLLLSSTLTQATIYVLRPMITYRAIELDANAAQVGLIAALYALFPVLLALQFGSWVGKLGEAKFVIYGTLAMMVTSAALIFSDSLVTLGIATAAAGLAHLACMVGGQSMATEVLEDSDISLELINDGTHVPIDVIEVLKKKALERAKFEGIDKDDRLKVQGDFYFNNL